MKKTLKLLMAIVLFAVVLMIATSVNAAVVADESATKDMNYLMTTPKTDGGTDYFLKLEDGEYKFQQNTISGDIVKLDKNNAVIDLNGKTIGEVLVPAGVTVTLKDSASGTIGEVTVKGTLNTKIDLDKVYLEAGNLNVDKSATIADLESKVNYTLKENAGKVTKFTAKNENVVLTVEDGATIPTTANLIASEGTFITVTDKEGTKYFVNEDAMSYSIVLKSIPDGAVVPANNVEAMTKEYAVVITPSYNGKEVDGTIGTVALANVVSQNKASLGTPAASINNDTTVYSPITFKSELSENDVITISFTYTDKSTSTTNDKITLTVKTAEPTTDPTAEPTTEPTVAPTTDPNGEKDDTPKTGDTIIPATAVLAVVVVANVVYFARSKRS